MVSDPALAKDCYQESVIRLWRGLPSFHGESKLATWLYRIAYRVCLDQLSANKRSSAMLSIGDDGDSEDFVQIEDSQMSGAKIESKVAAKDSIEKALAKLPPEQRAMVVLFYWNGLSIEEVSQVTDRPANTVKVYLHRARAQMRDVLKAGGYPQGS